MVEFKDYFEPINSELKSNCFTDGTYGSSCLKEFADNKNQKTYIALIGVAETRNSNIGVYETDIDLIRSYFYKLAEIPRIEVVDFGNLKLGKTVKDTYASVKFVVNELIKKKITPIVIGGSQDLTVSIVRGIPKQDSELELSLFDARFDDDDNEFHSTSYLNKLDEEFGEELLVSILGHQSYLVPTNNLRMANKRNWSLQRLGTVRNNFNQVEPLLRDSDVVSFDISCIRQNECPAASFSSPNGLYTEEACQIANLSGLSDKLKVFSIFEYVKNKDAEGQSAHLIAQIIWHFIYGVAQRKGDFPVKDIANYKKIYVKLEKIDNDLVFYENQQNKRFWVEIPQGLNKGAKIIACSENDYQRACNNEIPDRIWQNISRYLK